MNSSIIIKAFTIFAFLVTIAACSGDEKGSNQGLQLVFLDGTGAVIPDNSLTIFENDDFEVLVSVSKSGAALDNQPVSLNITRGTLTIDGGRTDSNGETLFTLNIKNVIGDIELNGVVEYQGKVIYQSLNLTVVSNTPVMTLSLLDDLDNAYGVESNPMDNTKDARVVVHIERPSGDVLSSTLVQFVTTLGELSLALANTDGNGDVEVVLSTDTTGIGEVTASATVDGQLVSATTPVYSNYNYGNPRAGVVINEVFSLGGMWVADATDQQISGTDDFSPAEGNHPIEHGETITLRTDILSEFDDSVIFPQSMVVSFTSDCAEAGKAELGVNGLAIAVVASSGGFAQTTYLTNDCFYEDVIEATFSYGGITYVSRATVDLPLPEVDQLGGFSSDHQHLVMMGVKRPTYTLVSPDLVPFYADPSTIPNGDLTYLSERQVSGFSFEVLAEDGTPLVNQLVDFSLSPASTAEPELTLYSTLSDSEGKVSSTVTAGEVAGDFSIIAQTGSGLNALMSISPPFSVSSGIPVDGGLSLASTMINPNAWNKDGVLVTLVATAKDRMGEFVQDGTVVRFNSEFGQLSKSYCVTQNGTCSVIWSSLASDSTHPRARDIASNNGLDGKNDRFGRSMITAMVVGEETFVDGDNGGAIDNRYDEIYESASVIQLPEVFYDYNENTVRDSVSYVEGYYDFNKNNSYTAADSVFQGGACILSSAECNSYIMLHEQLNLVMSSNIVKLYLSEDLMNVGLIENYLIVADTTLVMDASVSLITDNSPYFLVPPSGTQLYFGVADNHGNIPPLGTQIEIKANAPGIGFTAANESVQSSNQTFVIGSGTEAYFDWFRIFVNAGVIGSATIKITTPDSVIVEKTLLLEGQL